MPTLLRCLFRLNRILPTAVMLPYVLLWWAHLHDPMEVDQGLYSLNQQVFLPDGEESR